MERYNYLEAITGDVLDHIRWEYAAEDIAAKLQERDDWAGELYEALWVDDGVTGNASGSYYCSAWRAEEAITHNWDLLAEALREFCCDVDILERGAEYCDVTIRCYLLGQAIGAALDVLEEEAAAHA